jgi:hypothetical protein
MEGDLRIVPLTSQILDLDLAAYRASPKAISAHSAGRWPGADLSHDEARRLMAIHEAEHSAGTAYAYAVVDADGARELGCTYLRPLAAFLERTGTRLHTTTRSTRTGPDRTVTFWLIDNHELRPSTPQVLHCIRRWLHQWRAAGLVYRCLPAEAASVAALEAANGLRPLTASGQELPYLWFADEDTTAAT